MDGLRFRSVPRKFRNNLRQRQPGAVSAPTSPERESVLVAANPSLDQETTAHGVLSQEPHEKT